MLHSSCAVFGIGMATFTVASACDLPPASLTSGIEQGLVFDLSRSYFHTHRPTITF